MEAKARQIPKMEALKDKGILKKEWTSPILSSPSGRAAFAPLSARSSTRLYTRLFSRLNSLCLRWEKGFVSFCLCQLALTECSDSR